MNDNRVTMTGGGSHRANEKLRKALAAACIEYTEYPYLPRVGYRSFWSSKKRVFVVAAEDVEKCKLLGLSVKRER